MRRINFVGKNELWAYLRAANHAYISVEQYYLAAFKVCESKGVKFEDIRKYTLNEAKRAGLYVKVANANGDMVFPTKKEIKGTQWYHEMTLFCQWVTRNYISYKKEKPKGQKAKAEKSKKVTTKTVVRRDADGKESRTTTTNVSSESGMNAPVEDSLNDEQILAIILQNMDILKLYAEERGAEDQFEALVEALEN